MTIIHGLSETLREVERCVQGWTGRALCAALIACGMIGQSFTLTAWSADLPYPAPIQPKTVVVAGVGYENSETSTITVKTYDAENGEILSLETYELNVREDIASAGSQPRERIFAGGVGSTAEGLSAFPLRAYDAATGRFLWEGLLNLNVGNQESGATHRIVANLVAPEATATQVHSRGAADVQPQFLLRAVDSATGQLLWTDHFSTWTGRLARPEHVDRAIIDQTEKWGVTPSQQIEFRVRMTDDLGRRILWEDTIEPIGDETELAVEHDDAAEILPAWRGSESEEMNKEEI